MSDAKTRRLIVKICVLVAALTALICTFLAVMVLLLPQIASDGISARVIVRVVGFVILVGGCAILYKLARWLAPDLWG